MIHLFVIADDFTGALDTGVQFASYGAATKVVVGTGLQALEADAQTQVLPPSRIWTASPAAAYTTSAACPLPKVCLERTPLSR